MRSVNRLTILGNVGSIHAFAKATKVSIATNRTWTDKEGERHERTDWVPVTILDRGQAEWIAANVAKGDPVYVEAKVRETSYGEGDDKTYTIDIVADVFNLLRNGKP